MINLLIVNILVYKIKCDDETTDCDLCKNNDVNCRPTGCLSCNDNHRYFYDNNKCLECEGLSNSPNSYYTLLLEEGQEDKCKLITKKENENQKLIYGQKQVVTTCPTDYPHQLGDICYSDQFENNDDVNKENSIYDCKYFYFLEEKNKFIYKNCLPEGTNFCPYNFKFYEGKECLNACPDGKKLIKKENNGDSIIYRCSSECNREEGEREYKYEEKDANNNVINIYCLNACPIDKKYHKIPSGDETNYVCVSECDSGYLPFDNECISKDECKTFLVEDVTNSIFYCYKKTDEAFSCPNKYPYLYTTSEQNYCLKSCADTNKNNNFFSTQETYFIELNQIKYCKDGEEGYFKDEVALKLVKDCKSSISGPFNDHGFCKDKCNEKKHLYNTLECIDDSCEAHHMVESSNVCYDECPNNSEKKFIKNGKCQECKFPENVESLEDDEGFYIKGNNTCYVSCSSIDSSKTYYHNDKDNTCYESSNGCKNNLIYKYSKYYSDDEKLRICYKSCLDIGEEYKIESDSICYTNANIVSLSLTFENIYFYKNSSSDYTKYISNLEEEALKECFKYGLKYLNGFQCVDRCSETNFKVLNTENSFGICFENYIDCNSKGYNYHNETQRICSKKCDSLTISNSGYNEPINLITEVNNCLKDCPDLYYQDKEFCIKSCNFYIKESKESRKLKCTDSCQFYEVNDSQKICVDKCQKEGKNIYYDSDGKCQESCSSVTGFTFSYNTTNDHQPCINSCPKDEGYNYYDENKICQKECKNYYLKSGEDIKCVDHCPNGNKVFPGNICKDSTENCPSEAPFFFNEDIEIEGETNPITVTKCVSSCLENGYDLYRYSNKECLKVTCSTDEFKFKGVCYDKCPDGLYISGNECVLNCESKLFKNIGGNLTCVPDCNGNYIISSGECVTKCPIGENYIVNNDNHCFSSCKQFNNQFYQKVESQSGDEDSYPIYECLKDLESCESNTGKPVSIEGTKECISTCGQLYKYHGVCYSSCISIEEASFSYSDTNGQKECKNECTSPYIYYGSDKICLEDCDNLLTNKTIDGNKCVDKCDINSDNKFLVNISNKYHCKQSCENPNKRFLKSNYICIEKCEIPNNYVVNEPNNEYSNECLSKCPTEKPYMRLNNGEYICSNIPCGEDGDEDKYKYYYMDTKICLEECGQLYYYKDENDNKEYCVNSCDFFKPLKLYLDEYSETEGESTIYHKKCVKNCHNNSEKRKYSKLNGYCDDKCDSSEFYFDNDESDYVCLSKCPEESTNEGQICIYCTDFEIKKYIDENGNCIDKCESSVTGYIYHNNGEYKCLNSCGNKKIEDNTCVDYCTNKPYINDNNCLEVCPFTRRFYLPNDNNNMICLYDCPNSTRYYTITESNTNMYYKCQANCNAYVPNLYSNMNATFCFEDGNCKNDYPYFEKEETTDENEIKKCYAQCPSDLPYYKEELTQNIECFAQCPDNTVHLPGSYLCIDISKCTTKKIKYKNRECVEQCSKNDKIFKNEELSYCLDVCAELPIEITNSDSGLLLTYDNQCVTSCDSSNSEAKDGKCECKSLFYIDKSTQYKKCISQSIQECKNYKDYPININNTNECIDYCNGILSSSGNKCYPDNYTCLEFYEKLIELTNGDKKCECIEKYYYYSDDNGNKIKKCLKEGEKCPSPFELLITETNECVQNCEGNYKFQFEKTCVSSCPSSSESDLEKNKCKCKYKYYIDENNNVICLKENEPCPDKYPLIIDSQEKKQCVSSCIGTGYDYYFNKTCKQNCDISQLEVTTKNDSVAQKYAEKKCKCPKIWYYDEITFEENCYSGSEEIDCDSFTNSKYQKMIYNTKQCISSCPNGYYEFNNYCLEKCEDYTEQNIETKSNKCSCRDYTEYDENNNGNIKCLTLDYCKENSNNYSIIEESKKCYKKQENKKCPNDYPFFFNGKCYSENHCPDKTKGDPYELKCICKYKWYQEGEIVTCLSETSNCPSNYPLLVFSTQECKVSNDLGLIEFNYTLYSNCPENTEKENDKCICIKNKDWYKEQTLDGKLYYFCALNECPDDKPYKVEGNDNKECLSTCGEKKKYRGICYDKCPDLTEVGNNNECILSPVNNDLTFDNLEQTITEKLLDLYKSSDASNIINSNSSQKIVTKDATVEFYGVNKNNKGNKHQNIQSDLSYIDISECMEKIYKSNGMKNDDDIIILKFDINTAPDKFLINPVEYKFIDSGTGKELDASLCEHNSIKISYPLHGLIQRYDNRRKKRNLDYMKIDLTSNNKDSLREKLDKGKEIVEEYDDTDIFNINDKIYSDICIAVEVDGKDLTLQDRINYFYPEMSICENNCTYNHTDYINERIYCDCSFKKEFDFKREYYPTVEIDTERVKNDQGSNMNIAVLKCIPNLKYKKSLSGNGGFIFMLIIIAIEFVLLLIIIILGISSLLNKLKNKMKKEDNEEEDEDVDIEVVSVSNTNQEEKKEKEKETQRKLNVPPKRKENYGMEFIPQEYVFLFFNQNEKGVIKKVERDSVPFKTQYNTRILLEKNKNVNYDNIKPRGPFPGDQNILVIVDNMNDSISDYIYDDENEDNERKNSEQNAINNNNNEGTNKQYEPLSSKINKKNKKRSHNSHKKDDEKYNEKYGQNIKKYKKKIEFSITDYDPSDENYSEIDFDNNENQEKGFIESIKKEQRLLKKNYEIALQNKNSSNFVIMLFTEIIDKIYITKILLFTRKFDILSLQLSVYILCHTLLVILLALFYDVKTIEKIWNNDNYPGLGFYLLYGFLACIIIWIIYKIILCSWSNNDKIKEILKLIHINKKYGINNEKMMEKKYNNLAWKIKLKIIIYSIIEFLLLAFCFIYFVTFCTVYTGTKDKVFKSYGIALIEILIIKIIYGIVLAILRKVSLSKEKKTLYDIVVFMNTYLV